MRNNILTFLLGIFVAISFAATTTDLLTVKPATPRYYEVETFYGLDSTKDCAKYIKSRLKKGWILKSAISSRYDWVVVMEKY